jgi:hypothetical protein
MFLIDVLTTNSLFIIPRSEFIPGKLARKKVIAKSKISTMPPILPRKSIML